MLSGARETTTAAVGVGERAWAGGCAILCLSRLLLVLNAPQGNRDGASETQTHLPNPRDNTFVTSHIARASMHDTPAVNNRM